MPDDDGEEWQFTKRGILSAVKTTKIERIPCPVMDAKTLGLFEQLSSGHHLQGVTSVASDTLLLFRLADTFDERALEHPLRVMPWGWPGRFGASLTLTCYFAETNHRTRIAISSADSDTLASLAKGKARLAVVKGKKPLAWFSIDFNAEALSRENLEFHLKSIQEARPTLFLDEAAHYWEILAAQPVFQEMTTNADRLSLGWLKHYDSNATAVSNWFHSLRERGVFPPAKKPMPATIAEFTSLVSSAEASIPTILEFLHNAHDGSADFISDFLSFGTQSDDPWTEVSHFLAHLIGLYQISPAATKCGRQLSWYDPRDNTYKVLTIDPKSFPPSCNSAEYWERQPWDVMHFGRGVGVGASDFPVKPQDLCEHVESMPVADDPVAVAASADALLEEAMSNKIGTIPAKACVDLAFGPFDNFEITEAGPEVFFVCRTKEGEYLQVNVEPRKRYCSFRMSEHGDVDAEIAERIEAGVKLLFAAIIRDFWVVENRDAVFATRAVGKRNGNESDDSRRVVYVPRVRYVPKADAERCATELAHAERRSHFVRGHIRRSKEPADYQLILASRYGINVPQGYTFVRPHERGKSKRDVIYRSRSALRCMYQETNVVSGEQPSRWFQFEKDVRTFLEGMGFDVQHIAASRRGDGGIDVFATKGNDFDAVNWVVQCKCWKTQRRVYPNVVRELLGTLIDYPQGTRGMVVTTSSFSSGACELAKATNIRLVDGQEFVRLTETLRG